MNRFLTIFILLSASAMLSGQEVLDSYLFSIPELSSIEVDGNLSDWEGKGYEIKYLATIEHQIKSKADLDYQVKLGWDKRGLLFHFDIKDDMSTEFFGTGGRNNYFNGDFIKIFVSSEKGKDDIFSIGLIPGMSGQHKGKVKVHYQYPKNRNKRLLCQAAIKYADKAYTLEVLIPWYNLGFKPVLTEELAIQVLIGDKDNPKEGRSLSGWYNGRDPFNKGKSYCHIQRVQISNSPSKEIPFVTKYIKDKGQKAQLILFAPAEYNQKAFQLKQSDKIIHKGNFELNKRFKQAEYRFEYNPFDLKGESIKLILDENGESYPLYFFTLEPVDIIENQN